jgi:hypothetical protein
MGNTTTISTDVFQADYSISVNEDENDRRLQGQTADLLDSFNSPDGKILNALDFSRVRHGAINPPNSIASESAAFRQMIRRVDTLNYPARDMRWGVAATEGAFSSFHIDSDGLGTYISCINRNSSKWWVVISPKYKSNISEFASVEKACAFHNRDGVDSTRYDSTRRRPSRSGAPEAWHQAVRPSIVFRT